MKARLLVFFRWIAVIPGTVFICCLVNYITSIILVSCKFPILSVEISKSIYTPIILSFMGSWIAPSHKFQTAVVLSSATILFSFIVIIHIGYGVIVIKTMENLSPWDVYRSMIAFVVFILVSLAACMEVRRKNLNCHGL
jgi:hypothetical protein